MASDTAASSQSSVTKIVAGVLTVGIAAYTAARCYYYISRSLGRVDGVVDDLDYKYVSLAAEEARKGVQSGKGGPFGAIVVKNGEILARACNEVLSTGDPTAHAEIVAIQKACKALNSIDLSDCELYTSCEPSPMSFGAMYLARVKKLVYGATAESAIDVGFDKSHISDAIRGTATYQKNNCTVRRIVHPDPVQGGNRGNAEQ
eukprot:jgi/Mesvir1/211/Mv13555-RA.1